MKGTLATVFIYGEMRIYGVFCLNGSAQRPRTNLKSWRMEENGICFLLPGEFERHKIIKGRTHFY